MASSLPSTKALQVFEAVARNMSVTGAASVLHMTQSAVSRQLLGLEASLTVDLFRREKQRLYLTEAGRQFLADIEPILEQLKQACLRVSRLSASTLTIGIEPALASRWLIPQLPEFKQRCPSLEVELMTDMEQLYSLNSEIDVGFLFGNGDFAGARSHFFMAESLVAVCTPALLKTQPVAKHIKDSLSFPMLHHTAAYSSSEAWLAAAGLSQGEIESLPGSRLGSFGLMVDLAKQGQAVAIVPEYFVRRELASKELVLSCLESLPSDNAYYLVIPSHSQSTDKVNEFSDWILGK